MSKVKIIKKLIVIFSILLSNSTAPFIIHYDLDVYIPSKSSVPDRIRILKSINATNEYFKDAGLSFSIRRLLIKDFPSIEDMAADGYKIYNEESAKINSENLTIIITKNKDELCEETDYSISCRFLGGFSYVDPYIDNNIVVSLSSLYRDVTISHELGHYFGLEHTFKPGGDNIDDTPFDPGSAYSLFVSYDNCEMYYKDFKPMINNIMSYYSPCKKKSYKFTKEQNDVIFKTAYYRHRNTSYRSK